MATLEGRWWYGGVGATLYIAEIAEPEHVDGFVMMMTACCIITSMSHNKGRHVWSLFNVDS